MSSILQITIELDLFKTIHYLKLAFRFLLSVFILFYFIYLFNFKSFKSDLLASTNNDFSRGSLEIALWKVVLESSGVYLA